jgi:xanthine dehydrogenase accessory factor
MDDSGAILRQALSWARSGRKAALATVVSTWGSSPRAAGSRLAVDETGHMIGSVSGGCVEGEVLANAEETMATGRPALLEFGVSDGKAWSIGLACGGKIRVLVEKLENRPDLERIVEKLDRGDTTAALVAFEGGERVVIDEDRLDDLGLGPDSRRVLAATLARGLDSPVDLAGRTYFLEFWRPPLRLFIAGAVHIAQALAPIATAAGYSVAVVDPRPAFATAERFPEVKLHAEWPENFFDKIRLDSRCALVALTHEPKIDDPALIAALRSPAFYIGALGSRGTAEKRRARLRAKGFSEAALARIFGPIGIAIGASSPPEIAIAVAAQMTAVLRHAPAQVMGSAAE